MKKQTKQSMTRLAAFPSNLLVRRSFKHLLNRQNFQYHSKHHEQECTFIYNTGVNGKTRFVLWSIIKRTHFPEHTTAVRQGMPYSNNTFHPSCLTATFLFEWRVTVIYNVTLVAFLQLLHHFNVVQFCEVLVSVVLASLRKSLLITVKS